MTNEIKDEMPKQWIFPPRFCPRCRTFNSEATHTDSERGIQYRRCRTPLCRAVGIRFHVQGVPSGASRESASFDCPHCRNTYKRQGALTKHVQREHPDQDAGKKGETADGNDDTSQ